MQDDPRETISPDGPSDPVPPNSGLIVPPRLQQTFAAPPDSQAPGGLAETAIPSAQDIAEGSDSALDAFRVELKHSSPRRLPKQIDRYHIIQLLGEGGMGAVYKAEQRVPIKRLVALKVVRAGHETAHIIDRFNSERQALARMDHPCIAKVLDAGTTEDGQPFFVMEYVPGAPVTEFADANHYTIERRLQLFIQICEAVQHAHSKAILHRDIKPQNVLAYLADGVPTVKIIDFGIAKAIGDEKLSSFELTAGPGQILGTPYAMSPEQADGSSDLDTRTDVYALGVLLYELLGGRLPFELKDFDGKTLPEVLAVIREREPMRLSTWLISDTARAELAAKHRSTSVSALLRTLKNELEWIPLMALRKSRDRRYESASQFSEDISNYLDQRPLIAGPESKAYYVRKFVGRNKLPLSIATASIMLLIVGVAAYTININNERNRTEDARQRAQGMVDFSKAVFRQASPSKGKVDISVAQAMEAAVADMKWRDVFSKNPSQVVDLKAQIGAVLRDAGVYTTADQLLSEAIKTGSTVLAPDDPKLAKIYGELASTRKELKQFSEAEKLYRKQLDVYRNLKMGNTFVVAEATNNLGTCLVQQQRFEEAATQFQLALEIARKLDKPNPDFEEACLNNLAGVAEGENRLEDALAMLRRVYQFRKTRLSLVASDDKQIAESLMNIGNVSSKLGRFNDALPALREALAIYQKRAGDDHPETLRCRHALAGALRGVKDLAESASQYELCIKGMLKRGNEMEKELAASRTGLGRTLQLIPDRVSQAEAPLLKALEYRLSAKDPNLQITIDALKQYYEKSSQPQKAKELDEYIASVRKQTS